MWSRREVVLGGALTILWNAATGVCCSTHAAGRRAPVSCTLPSSQANDFLNTTGEMRAFFTGNEPPIPTSDDRDFDYALAHSLAKISDHFGVTPGFAYFDDYDGLNAYATPDIRMNNVDGTVLMGLRLLNRLRTSPEDPDVSVVAVCAHEFGHIVQYKRNLYNKILSGQQTVKRAELQADFLAGYFAGVRKLEKPDFPAAVVAMTQYNAGDNMINNPQHHGTADERAAAIVRGFEAAFRERVNFDEALQKSTNYVSQI